MASRQEMPAEAEEIMDRALDRKQPLRLPWSCEPTHLICPLVRRLMRDFRSSVATASVAVADARQEFPTGRAITPQAIGHKQMGDGVQPG